jgi:hypothetical protein
MTLRNRWKARPVGSALLRAFIVIVPIAAAFSVTALLTRLLPRPDGTGATALWWALVLGGSLLTLFLVERVVRRLGPLAVLLRISMAFPGRAPSRFRVARRSGNPRELRAQLERARERGEKDAAKVAETILALATALSHHDRSTRGHSERTRVFTDMLAEEMKLPTGARDRLRWAALLHDIGKLQVPATVLNKKGVLDDREWELVRRHPDEGMAYIAPLVSWLGEWADTVPQHHEWWDGSGYPRGLRSGEICLGARIVAVADSYDTMTATRPYRKPLSAPAARREVARSAGQQFDPGVVRALLNLSIGRLWWRLGAISWLAQIPVIGRIPQLLGQAATVEQSAIAAAKAAAAAATIGVAGALSPFALAARDAQADIHGVHREVTEADTEANTSSHSGDGTGQGRGEGHARGQGQGHARGQGRGQSRGGNGLGHAKGGRGLGHLKEKGERPEHGGRPEDAGSGATGSGSGSGSSSDTGSSGTGPNSGSGSDHSGGGSGTSLDAEVTAPGASGNDNSSG